MTKRIVILMLVVLSYNAQAQDKLLSEKMAMKLTAMPLHCMHQEYPNKSGHTYNSKEEVPLSPQDLHPTFYGCFDWHSSVHGHWMLVKVLNEFPNIPNKQEIIEALAMSFQPEKLKAEADYFSKYKLSRNFERTYGWAWLLKLDEELQKSNLKEAKIWHKNMQPLTDTITKRWKTYLPKQTYPNRTGVHPNSAFALGFAIDWAKKTGDKDFEKALVAKAISFYGKDENTPAYLEPDGSDFFSPSLEIADLMSRIYNKKDFEKWFMTFMSARSLENVSKIPVISDLNDYHTVHLVGLSFSRAWCMQSIAQKLPDSNQIGRAHV